MPSFRQLRQQRHEAWLAELKRQLRDLVTAGPEAGPEQIYLFGSRARGDWDGLSDTDLLVVASNTTDAELWVNLLLDRGLAQDVIGMDREAWMQLPEHPSAIWRGVARDAQPLLEELP